MSTQIAPSFGRLLLVVAIAPEEIGQRLRAAREAKGWTQMDFAIKARKSIPTIGRWEAGKLPRVSELIRIADLLDLDAGELVESAPTGEDQLVALRGEVAEVRDANDRLISMVEELLRRTS